jgi:hypothetical protein
MRERQAPAFPHDESERRLRLQTKSLLRIVEDERESQEVESRRTRIGNYSAETVTETHRRVERHQPTRSP